MANQTTEMCKLKVDLSSSRSMLQLWFVKKFSSCYWTSSFTNNTAHCLRKKRNTSSVSTVGGPLDRSLKVAFPEPTAVEAAGESTEAIPRLDVLGPIPSVEYQEKCYMYVSFKGAASSSPQQKKVKVANWQLLHLENEL